MTALHVLWFAPGRGRATDPSVSVVRDASGVAGALATLGAGRVLLHDGPDVPTPAERAAHLGAVGVAVEEPSEGLVLGADRIEPHLWFSLRRGRSVSAPADAWRRALERFPQMLGSSGDAHAAYELMLDHGSPAIVPTAPPAPADAEALGHEAVRLARSVPATRSRIGLTAFREVSVAAFTRRRLLRALPPLGRRLPGADDAARRDAAFWDGVHAEATDEEWRALTGAVAILMYHGFGDGEPASRYVLPAERLRRQLRLLRLLRRRIVDLEDYVAARERNEPVDPRSVVLTIDDGYRDAYDVAAPILAAHGATATLFVPSGRIGGANDWSDEPALAGRPIADRELLRTTGPIRIGSHAHSHPALTEIDVAAARDELRRSKEELGAVLGAPVRTFAYPYGDEDETVRGLVTETGFAAAVSSRGGKNLPAERLDTLRRIEIRGTDPLWRFALAVLVGSTRPISTFRDGLER